MSDCLAGGPAGWIESWLFNDLAFFNTRAEALARIPPRESSFSVFAYKLLTQRFVDGHSEDLVVSDLPVEPVPASFRSLGFDIVNKELADTVPFFQCSPLSCNGMLAKVPVNTFCLLATLEAAIMVAADFSREPPEPGAYYVLEVLREGPSAGT